ncbi:hypothetical protein ACPC37_34700 [Streptomyces griseoincarnatus]|uniref:hypothetical protein n=1 Tax=Paenibacillus glucanolyticus TaxID=59843 RepID=UPI0036A2321C
MSRDKYFKGYNPDFVSNFGKRDWQKDMELIKIGETSDIPYCISEFKNMLPYYHQQYAAAQEEIARINCDYYADKQRFVVQRRELEESKTREQKLREAIETAINEKAAWGDPGNALDVVTRYLADTLASLYPKEETK